MPPTASLRDGFQAGREGGGALEGTGIPSHRRRGCSRPGAGVEVVQPSGVSTSTPAPGLLQDEPADATGYPLPPHL